MFLCKWTLFEYRDVNVFIILTKAKAAAAAQNGAAAQAAQQASAALAEQVHNDIKINLLIMLN